MDSIKSIFLNHTKLTFDRNFLLKVVRYVENFKRKDSNTINFLGGNLVGVYPFKWLDEERLVWVHDILGIDDFEIIKDEIHSLDAINPEFNISSNVTSHSFVWCTHMFLTSPHLSEKDRLKGAVTCLTMLQYGYLSSIHTRFFKYPANESIAMAVYEGLSKKWYLKKYGTWAGVIQARAEDIVSKKSIHANYISNLKPDEEMVELLNDVQGRIKAMIKKLFDEYIRIRDSEARIAATGRFSTMDGKQVLKESINKYERVRERIAEIIPDTHNFIKKDVVEVITKTVGTVSERQLTDALLHLSKNFEGKKNEGNRVLVEDTIIYMFDLIRKEKIRLDHVPSVIIKLRSMFRSSRAIDPSLISIRQRTGDMVAKAMPRATTATVSSVRIAVILYIVLRALLE